MACIGLSQLETFVFGNQTCFIVMGNLFCSGYRIHRHFALKGSSHGRSVDKPLEEIDETTTLKGPGSQFCVFPPMKLLPRTHKPN
ncbi:hypothetical protein AB3S75_012761 [Citrus x aurantiifolia]